MRAPGSGTVVAVAGDVPDNTPLPDGGVEFPGLSLEPSSMIFGNHVVIDHGNGEFSVLAHLQRASVVVERGDSVQAKQPIGRLGLSGNTDFPHIHYQLQDGPDALTAEGVPFTFVGFGALQPGSVVESADKRTSAQITIAAAIAIGMNASASTRKARRSPGRGPGSGV